MKRIIKPMLTAVMAVFLLCNAILPTNALTRDSIVDIEAKRTRGGKKRNYTFITVVWDTDGGSSVKPYRLRTDKPIGVIPTSTKSGYTLDGWYTSKTGGTKLTKDTVITKNCKYYARWTKNSSTPTPTASPKPTVKPTASPKPTATPKPTTKESWITEGGKKYYYKNNKKLTGLQTIGKDKYYFDTKTGEMASYKEVKINNKWYFFYSDGKMWKGFKYFNDTKQWKYYKKSDGVRVTGQQHLTDDAVKKDNKNHYFYFDDNGVMAVKKFVDIKNQNKTCYYDDYGHMVYGQKKIGDYWYMFNTKSGARVSGFYNHTKETNPGGGAKTVYYRPNGTMVYGQYKIGDDYYYFDEGSGAMLKDTWKWIANQKKLVLYKPDGKMAKGKYTYKGVTYNFDQASGKVIPKENIPTQFSAETAAIVNAHRWDFNSSNMNTILKNYGGYTNYVKSLGGVFEKYAGKNANVETAKEFKEVAEYTYGLMTIWGCDYYDSDPSPSRNTKWRRNKDSNGWGSDSFYVGRYNFNRKSCNAGDAGDTIDAMLDGSSGRDIATINCVAGASMQLKKAGLGKDNYTWCYNFKQYGGYKVLTKTSELQVGDIVYYFTSGNKPSASALMSAGDANKFRHYHVALVGEVDKAKGTVTIYDSGHYFTNSGLYKHTHKISSQNLNGSNWLAVRVRELK